MIQIRFGVFETNSSSTHSITICTPEEWFKLEQGDHSELSKSLVDDYNDYLESNLETYSFSTTTPKREVIQLFGDYGYDG